MEVIFLFLNVKKCLKSISSFFLNYFKGGDFGGGDFGGGDF